MAGEMAAITSTVDTGMVLKDGDLLERFDCKIPEAFTSCS